MSQERLGQRQRRRKLTLRRLTNIALHYLQRRSTSIAHFRLVLRRRIARETEKDDQAGAMMWIEQVVGDMRERGLLDDRTYATAKAASDRAWSKAPAKTRARLRAKGIDAGLAASATRDDGTAEWSAALAVARRRRLGPFRETARDRETERRDLAVLARSGITWAVSKKLMALDTPP